METSCIIGLKFQADLIESFHYPLIPVAEHIQPLHLPLSEHLWRNVLSSRDTREKT